MVQTNSTAIYDTLLIAKILVQYNKDFNFSEINLFCYFACLLSLYNGQPLSYWGYNFIKNEFGVPISAEVQISVQRLIELGHLANTSPGYYNITEKGINFLDTLNYIQRYQERRNYIENACNTLLVNSIGHIRQIINQDPVISTVKESPLRVLLNETSGTTELLYKQFTILKSAIKCDIDKDLFIVALSWLKCVQNIEEFGYVYK